MVLTEHEEVETTVKADGQLEVRTATIIMRDGVEIAKTYRRHVVDVGASVLGEDKVVKDIAKAVHTPTRVANRRAFLNARKA